ncbi:hypothetical protein [Nocardia terpenica]|uniref:hypothetical protein n=1 Tax=Nocardia terpenica TaxID=455432 RepID=UPI000A6317C1|nr:hypothetical protein [Nocardia terpenica]NQE92655.1 hypothetical protein [Nocardia terpenica]
MHGDTPCGGPAQGTEFAATSPPIMASGLFPISGCASTVRASSLPVTNQPSVPDDVVNR